MNIYGEIKEGLLDSGASITVLRACTILNERHPTLNTTNVALKAANGGFLTVMGWVPIPIGFRTTTVLVNAIVVNDITQDLILGVDFFKAAGLRIVNQEGTEVGSVDVLEHIEVTTEVELQERDRQEFQRVVNALPVSTSERLTKTVLIEHVIELKPDAKPFTTRPHLYSPYLEEKMKIELDRMIGMGIIEASNSPVASPIVPTTKKDGSVRLCLDSRKLNDMTIPDKFPIPNINHIFARMRKCAYITSIDLASAFWQVNLSSKKLPGQFASSRELTAFVFPGRGLFHFQRMPFGLTNSPATMSRLMYRVLGHDLEPAIFVYIDDIIILAESVQHMLELLNEVGKRLSAANLAVNLGKCRFFVKEAKYLGYLISAEGIRADPDKLKTMQEYPKPKSVKEVRRFLGLTGYYRRLIQGYSEIAVPLTNLLRKSFKPFSWTSEADEAFQRLRNAMCTSPVVSNPDFALEFCIQCDASDTAAGAVLTQVQEGEEKIIAFFSHKWLSAEKNYAATEKEAACVLKAIEYFRCYVYGQPFTVITDAKALTHIKSIRTDGSSRLSRWALDLNQHPMTIKHRSGKLSIVPDALSRAVCALDIQISASVADPWLNDMRQRILQDPQSYPDFRLEGDKLFKYELMKDDVCLGNFRWKEYVSVPLRAPLARQLHHELCHLGPAKCASVARREFLWPGMLQAFRNEVQSCDTCKACKPRTRNNHVPMGLSRVANTPFQRIALDHFGPTVRSRRGHRWLLVVVDIHTKFVLLKPCKTGKAAEVVRFLEDSVFLAFGVPEVVISDNARALIGRTMKRLLLTYHVKHWTTSYYHAQANPAERYIRTVSSAIRSLVLEQGGDQRGWDTQIPRIQWALNTTEHEVTKKSPFFANYGRQHVRSGEDYALTDVAVGRDQMTNEEIQHRFQVIRQEMEDAVKAAIEKRVERYNRGTRLIEFRVDDRVWRPNNVLSSAINEYSQKLAPKFVPCRIIKALGTQTYIVQDEVGNTRTKVHANDLHQN